jgi:flagellar basal-body rod protein FlgG
MAITALHSAATGLSALNTQLDVIANNLANLNTTGFKAMRPNFQDLLYMERLQPGVENANGDRRPTGLYVGLGTKISGTQLDFNQGNLTTTGRETDIAIEGPGFLRVAVEPTRANGGFAYTRAGNLALNRDGELVLANDGGPRIQPAITIPTNATKIDISTDGRILATIPGNAEPVEVGQIELATFVNPSGLKMLGENLYAETVASGPPILGPAGVDQRGQIRQGFVEGSNVDPTKELIELIKAQRAFEMNSQTIRSADQALQTVAQIRR